MDITSPVDKVHTSPVDLLVDTPVLKISAPMVRYSKLPFRLLVKNHNVDIVYTPMILADVFKHSEISRQIDFQTSKHESNLIVQFGASNSKDFADAASLVAKHCSGVNLNCGCPQKWAIGEGIGCHLMEEPEIVADIIDQAKRRTSPLGFKSRSGTGFPVSVKIRVHRDLKKTVEFAKRAEKAGADWITVHGRTRNQRSSEAVDLDAIKLIKESVAVPVFANGDVFSLEDVERIVDHTGADGVMAARGLLQNPALFDGVSETPVDCLREFVDLSLKYGNNSFIFHHHLMYMLESSMSKAEKKSFNILSSVPSILDYLKEHYDI